MWKQVIKELGSTALGLALLAFAGLQFFALWTIEPGMSLLDRAFMLVMATTTLPTFSIPLLLGAALAIFGPVSRSRRLRIERIGAGEEQVEEPIPEYERDRGFVGSHLTGLIRSGFMSAVFGAIGAVMLMSAGDMFSVWVAGWLGVFAALFIALTPLKWWREWRQRQAVFDDREDWEGVVVAPSERGAEAEGVRFDFDSERGESDQKQDVERAEEVTQAR